MSSFGVTFITHPGDANDCSGAPQRSSGCDDAFPSSARNAQAAEPFQDFVPLFCVNRKIGWNGDGCRLGEKWGHSSFLRFLVLRQQNGNEECPYFRCRLVPADDIARIHATLGNADQAFEWLDRAFEEHAQFPFFSFDPAFDELRSDPRMAELVARIRATENKAS